ncbi:MAG: hypothetical protein II214_00120 [Alistipes sp.]|nr:hypothetical protein [Alistipes sp.]
MTRVKKLEPKADKPMASALLAEARIIIQATENYDVTAFKMWLLSEPTKPLICIGNGGKHTSYAALLYEMNSTIARTVTPLEFASMSPTTIANSKILLLSSSGKNIDIGFAIKRAMKYCPNNTAGFTFVDDPAKNKMISALKPENIFCFKNPYTDGFISIRSKIFTYGLLYKVFADVARFADKLNFTPHYDYFINRNGILPELGNIKHFILLYGSYGEPVAHDIESIMVEGGIASVQVCDYRNFCHGRFIFASNHCQSKHYPETDACVIMLTTPREAKIAEYLRNKALPANMPIVQINTDLQSSLATIQLLLDSLHFVFDLAENHCGINPNSPHNFSGIDKRVPISQVRFVSTLKQYGELKYQEE